MRLARLIAEAVAAGAATAIAAVVVEGGETEVATAGSTLVGADPVGPETRFPIGPVTELLTAVGALRMAERGSIDLDVPIGSLVHGLRFDDAARGDRVTLRHLLSHSSGLPASGRDFGPAGPTALRRAVFEDLVHHRFLAPPGTVGVPSTTAFAAAGLVMEVAAGESFPDVLAAEVLEPCRAAAAGYPSDELPRDLAWPHLDPATPLTRLPDNAAEYPSRFMLASPADLACFAVALLTGGLLDGAQRAELARPAVSRHIEGSPYPLAHAAAGFGLGCLSGTYRGVDVIRQGGIGDGFGAAIDLFPERGLGLVLLTTGASDLAFTRLLGSLYELVLGPPLPQVVPAPVGLDGDDRLRLPGSYLDVGRGRLVLVTGDGSGLRWESDDASGALRPIGGGSHAALAPGGSIPAWFPPGPAPPGVLVWGGAPLLRTEVRRWAPGGREVTRYSGVYEDLFWPDPGTDVHLDLQQMTVTKGGWEASAAPIGPRALRCHHGLLEMDRTGLGLRRGYATRYRRKG